METEGFDRACECQMVRGDGGGVSYDVVGAMGASDWRFRATARQIANYPKSLVAIQHRLTEQVKYRQKIYASEMGLVCKQAFNCQTRRLHTIALPTDLGGERRPASTPHNDTDPGPVDNEYEY